MATNTGEGIGNDVAKFYNKLEEKGKEFRQDSRIYHMRNFNNWLKSMLINEVFNLVHVNNTILTLFLGLLMIQE